MRRRSWIHSFVGIAVAAVLLMIVSAGNVLAEGVGASVLGLYVGVPGRGGRLASPRSDRESSAERAVQRLLITTAENAPRLRAEWEASARAAIYVDPRGHMDPTSDRYVVVLTDAHAEGKGHTVEMHPEEFETSRPGSCGGVGSTGVAAGVGAARGWRALQRA